MIERKNINSFFKENLNDIEVLPPEESWKIIEARLKEKKKRRIIPFWWKLSGVAAIFMAGFFSYNVIMNSIDRITSNSTFKTKTVTVDKKKSINSIDNKENQIVNSDENKTKKPSINSKKNNLDINLSTNNLSKKPSNIISLNKNISTNKALKSSVLNKNAITVLNSKINLNTTNKSNVIFDEKEKVATNNNLETKDIKTISDLKSYINTENNIGNGKIAMKNHPDIAIKGDSLKKLDSTQIAKVEFNELEELLLEKEKKIVVEQKINRWQVTPNLAPVYFSSISNGSPLDEKFSQNTKQYNTNLSYGLAVNYAVNKKLKIRTGVNTVNVEYNTNDVSFQQTQTESKSLKNLNANTQGSLIEIDPIKNVNTLFNRIGSERFDGVLNQRLGYIEIPLEVSYNLTKTKIGVEFIGGLSSMILSNNQVFLEADGLSMIIGEANNLNKLHFSSNVGLGFNYSFFKHFNANVEPVFKYQLNTFSNDSGNFKPYIFGVYSGISYNF